MAGAWVSSGHKNLTNVREKLRLGARPLSQLDSSYCSDVKLRGIVP